MAVNGKPAKGTMVSPGLVFFLMNPVPGTGRVVTTSLNGGEPGMGGGMGAFPRRYAWVREKMRALLRRSFHTQVQDRDGGGTAYGAG